MTVRKLVTLALACLCAAGWLVLDASGASAATTTVAAATTCTGTLQINSMTFNPTTVTAGQTATVTVVVQNCTQQTIQTGVIFTASWLGTGTGIPPGCPVYDPFPRTITLAPGGTTTTTAGYSTFAGCTATGLHATATINGTGTVLARQSADLTIQGGTAAGCTVTYRNLSEWSTGFVAQVSIANTGPTINSWTLGFSYPGDQRIGSAWGATVTQSGSAVTAVGLPYDSTIASGASVSFGMVGAFQAGDAPPTSFTLNGQTCHTA